MNTLIRLGVCLLAVGAPRPVQSAELPARGKVLVLDNERTLEGEIVRHGEQYSIQRTIGETWVPAAVVVGLCETHEEAFRILRARANLADPDERLRLARWCQKHELREQALEEAAEAVRLRPTHAESRRLLNYLQRPPTPAPEQPAPPAETRESDPSPAAAVEVSNEAMSQFVTKVQPILMNACANCHATGRGGPFKLTRSLSSGPASTKLSQQNLASVLAQVNPEQPQASPLLLKALSIHGEASQPPLKGRQVAAFHTLENWVRLTVGRNPQLRDQAGKTAAGGAAAEPKPEQPEARPSHWAAEVPPKAAPKLADPFDPAAFNRQMHPPGKAGGPRP